MESNFKKNDTNELIYKTETDLIDFENKPMVAKGETWGRDKLGAWDEHTHTTVYQTDNQQVPAVEHGELYSILCNNLNGKRI